MVEVDKAGLLDDEERECLSIAGACESADDLCGMEGKGWLSIEESVGVEEMAANDAGAPADADAAVLPNS